jgi:hypothetical protein
MALLDDRSPIETPPREDNFHAAASLGRSETPASINFAELQIVAVDQIL